MVHLVNGAIAPVDDALAPVDARAPVEDPLVKC